MDVPEGRIICQNPFPFTASVSVCMTIYIERLQDLLTNIEPGPV